MSSCDGKVKASARGGTPPYTLSIGFPVTISVTSNVSCYGGSDGSATGSASGGSGVYVGYSWKKNGAQVSTSQNPTGLSAGTYTLTVTDSAGAIGISSEITISQPDALSTTSTKTDVAIAGESTGAIDLTVSGGTAPYTYLWNDGVTTANRTGLAAGTYTVTVTDSNGCTATHSVPIAAPDCTLVFESVDVITTVPPASTDSHYVLHETETHKDYLTTEDGCKVLHEYHESKPFEPRGKVFELTIDGVVSSNMSPVRFYNAQQASDLFGQTHFSLNTVSSTLRTGGWGRLGTYSHTLYPTVYANRNGYFSYSLTLNPGVLNGEIVSIYGEVAVSEDLQIGDTLTWVAQSGPYRSRQPSSWEEGDPLSNLQSQYTNSIPSTPNGVLGKTFVLKLIEDNGLSALDIV